MQAIRVRVESGRISGEAPAGLPEGDVELRLADRDDNMSDEELALLNEALARGFESIKAGRFRSAADVIADLQKTKHFIYYVHDDVHAIVYVIAVWGTPKGGDPMLRDPR